MTPVAALVLVAAVLACGTFHLADPDLWGHLLYGSTILDTGVVPRFDPYSYTANGARWVDHEWLAEVIFAALWRHLGAPGLIGFELLVCALVVALLLDATRSQWKALGEVAPDQAQESATLRTWGGVHPLVGAMGLTLALRAMAYAFQLRPQLFTMLFLALECALLARAERRLDRAAQAGGSPLAPELLVLPPLLALWANLHGGFVAGVGTLGIFLVSRLVSRHSPGWPERGWLVLVGGLALLAPLINPYGWDLIRYLMETSHRHALVSEWRALDPWVIKHSWFQAVVVLAAASCLVLGRGVAPWRAILMAITVVLAYRHIRHKVLFVIVAAPVVLHGLERMRRGFVTRWPRWQPTTPAAALCGAVIALFALHSIDRTVRELREDRLQVVFDRLDYPVDAIEFLKSHEVQGNLLAPLEWGQFAIWHLAPGARVFFDGRRETVYPDDVERAYFTFSFGQEGWERALDAYPTDVVLVQRRRELHPRLLQRADLALVYEDPAALIFVKQSSEAATKVTRLTPPDALALAAPDLEFP